MTSASPKTSPTQDTKATPDLVARAEAIATDIIASWEISHRGMEFSIAREAACAGLAMSADALSTKDEEIARLREALSGLVSDAENVLAAMDRYNEENGTHIGGAPFFRLGRGIHSARTALEGHNG